MECAGTSKAKWRNVTTMADLALIKSSKRKEKYITTLPKKFARLFFLSRCNILPIKSHQTVRHIS
jgi:hypothetical protein